MKWNEIVCENNTQKEFDYVKNFLESLGDIPKKDLLSKTKHDHIIVKFLEKLMAARLPRPGVDPWEEINFLNAIKPSYDIRGNRVSNTQSSLKGLVSMFHLDSSKL